MCASWGGGGGGEKPHLGVHCNDLNRTVLDVRKCNGDSHLHQAQQHKSYPRGNPDPGALNLRDDAHQPFHCETVPDHQHRHHPVIVRVCVCMYECVSVFVYVVPYCLVSFRRGIDEPGLCLDRGFPAKDNICSEQDRDLRNIRFFP